jgi:hypothetical protein
LTSRQKLEGVGFNQGLRASFEDRDRLSGVDWRNQARQSGKNTQPAACQDIKLLAARPPFTAWTMPKPFRRHDPTSVINTNED